MLPSQSAFTCSNLAIKNKVWNTRTRCEICPKLTIKTPERRRTCKWRLGLEKFFKSFIMRFDLKRDLILSWRRSLSYRNQFIDLHCKLMDWFLYVRDLRHERVKWFKNYLIFFVCVNPLICVVTLKLIQRPLVIRKYIFG